jgi:hypothetical protein
MVRDGLIPLLWFFRRFPEPVGLTSQILIAEEFMSCVPKAWAARIGTYRLHSETQPTDKTRLALIGLASEAYCELSFLKSILDEVSSDEPNIKRQIDLYIPTRSNWQDNAAQSYHAEYFRLIFATLGTNCRVVSQSEITAAHDAQDLRLYDLNDKMMLADNMIAHEALSRGAQWALTRPIAPDEEFVRLSPHHGFVIRRSPRIEVVKNDLEDSFRQNFRYQQRLESALTSRVFRQLPWPRWFMEWVRVNVEELVPTATRIHSGSAQSADARTSAGPRSPNSRGRQASSVVDKKPSRK